MKTCTSLVLLGRRGCALIGVATMLSACGGGASPAPHLSSSATSQSGAKGAATLTIQFPANYHHAMTHARIGATPAGVKRAPGSLKRTPQFIDPTAGDVLYVTVFPEAGGSYYVTPDGGVPVAANGSDNSQTFAVTIPAGLYSSATAVEKDSSGNEIASGSSNSSFSIEAGSSGNTLAITMDMIPDGVVLTTDIVAGGDATLLTASEGSTDFCAFGTPHQTIYAFTADDQAGYVLPGTAAGGPVDNNGSATVPTPQLYYAEPSDASTLAASTFANAFLVTFLSPSTSTISGGFESYSGPLGLTAYGYFTLAGAGSATCTPTGSFNPYSVSGAGLTSTLQITGGTAPYSVTETDGNCSLVQADAPLTDQWTFTSLNSGGECEASITDHNNTTTSAILYIEGP